MRSPQVFWEHEAGGGVSAEEEETQGSPEDRNSPCPAWRDNSQKPGAVENKGRLGLKAEIG